MASTGPACARGTPQSRTRSASRTMARLQRYIGRREYYDETHLAIAALVSDRAAER